MHPLPRTRRPDPLLKERSRRRNTFIVANLRRPSSLVGYAAAVALGFIHWALVPAGIVLVAVAAVVSSAGYAKEEWWSALLAHLGFSPIQIIRPEHDTPLLRSGNQQLALRAASDGHRQLVILRTTDYNCTTTLGRHHYRFTVVTSEVPSSIVYLSAHPRQSSRTRLLGDTMRGAPMQPMRRFQATSPDLTDRFKIRFSGESDEQIREVFSPSFSAWFAENGVSFELEGGVLAVFVDRVLNHADEFGELLHRAAEIEAALLRSRS